MDFSLLTTPVITACDLDSLDRFVYDSAHVATEDLHDLWNRVGDLFGRVLNNFKNLASHGISGFRRSELHAFMDNHAVTMRTFLSQPDTALQKWLIFVPHQMRCTYPQAVAYLHDIYQLVSPAQYPRRKDWLDGSCAILAQIRRDAVAGKPINTTNTHVLPVYDQLVTQAQQASGKLIKSMSDAKVPMQGQALIDFATNYANTVFQQGKLAEQDVILLVDMGPSNPQQVEMVAFPQAIGNVAKLKEVIHALIDMENELRGLHRLGTQSEVIGNLLDGIIAIAPDNAQLSRDLLSKLAEDTRLLATFFHLYGYAAATQLTIEHNLVLSLNNHTTVVS